MSYCVNFERVSETDGTIFSPCFNFSNPGHHIILKLPCDHMSISNIMNIYIYIYNFMFVIIGPRMEGFNKLARTSTHVAMVQCFCRKVAAHNGGMRLSFIGLVAEGYFVFFATSPHVLPCTAIILAPAMPARQAPTMQGMESQQDIVSHGLRSTRANS